MPQLDHPPKHVDFIIIGAGVMGMSIAYALKRKLPTARILIIEKENDVCRHASGLNSGVLHAGFYYTKDSLKAQFTRDGNEALRKYCEKKNIGINKCGKLVVTSNEKEELVLDTLKERAQKNGVSVEIISKDEAKKVEPKVKTFSRALYSPNTSTVNPVSVMQSLKKDILDADISLILETKYIGRKKNKIDTSKGSIEYDYLVNCAGLYADTIAKDYGFSENYMIMPFKGLYLHLSKKPGWLKTNIYPVPNIDQPFLGVHFTVTLEGNAKIGPTAIPAFWKEHYEGIENFNAKEFFSIIKKQSEMFLANKSQFRDLALEEMKKYSKEHLIKLASKMVEDVDRLDFLKWGKPAIRAQLLNTTKNSLEMDFVYEGDDKSFHLLNAVSPAFTCAFPMSHHISDEIIKLKR